ncbi:MAG: hypothetical protein CL666_14680 [Balneola sp.]|nr:hypothetical protein [Balneola sp.]|tara:strand:+ start:6123 stop:6443 length:321 start_codon:yes stop_codon:yes gene_type:complete
MAKKKEEGTKEEDVKRTKLYFLKAPKGYGYHAGETEAVPEKLASEFVKAGVAREATKTLPEDLPGRDALMEHGCETVKDVKEIEDFTTVDNIGTATAKELEVYFKK